MANPSTQLFRSLLVPLDGSQLAESVLPITSLLASRLGSKVTLVHILEERVPATVHGERHLTDVAESEAYLAGIADRLRSAGVSQVDTHVHAAPEGDVARSIVEHATEILVDLIVLCTHGSTGLSGFIYGSIAQQVMRDGCWPVLLMPPRLVTAGSSFELRRILVSLDGHSYHDDPALRAAVAIGQAFGAELYLVLVVETLETLSPKRALSGRLLPAATRAILDLEQRHAEEYLQQKRAECCASDTATSAEVVRGDPVKAVPDLAERIDPGLVVMATHGRAGLEAVLEGSIGPRITDRLGRLLLLIQAHEASAT
jgi:nucleotide-binding universal stress UspA family protein